MRLGFLGTLVPLYGKRYSPSWKTTGFLNQSWALLKSPLQDSWVCYEWLTDAHLPSWVLLNFTQGPFPSLIFRPDNFTYALAFLTGVTWRNNPTISYSWLGLICQIKIWMFNISVPDSYMSVCHSLIKDLGPASQGKDMYNFTTLKGDYCLTASWWYMNNSKSPTFTGPNILMGSVCNGSLIFNLTKSLNLTSKNSYSILATGHHQCILTKNKKALKNCITPPCHPCASTFYQQC
jgi:hypothetical protein